MANIEQMKKIIPLITREISCGQDVCELVFGVNASDLVSSTFDNNFDHRLTVLKDVQHGTITRMQCQNAVLDGMWSMLVGMTLVCLNWMRLCMFG